MTRTSARVEFIGQQNGRHSCIGILCCPAINYSKVDRTFPHILEYYKTVDEWTRNMQKFDKALRPMNTANTDCLIIPLGKIVIAIFVIVMAFFITIFLPFLGMPIVVIGLITLGMIAISLVYMLCRIVYKTISWQLVKKSLRESCGRESEINEVVSFHLRQENSLCNRKYYIECILDIATNGDAIDIVESGMDLASIPVATVVNDSSVYTEAIAASAPVISASDVSVLPVASAQVDVGVDGSAEDWNDDNFEQNLR